jgi:hypothetical protein
MKGTNLNLAVVDVIAGLLLINSGIGDEWIRILACTLLFLLGLQQVLIAIVGDQ